MKKNPSTYNGTRNNKILRSKINKRSARLVLLKLPDIQDYERTAVFLVYSKSSRHVTENWLDEYLQKFKKKKNPTKHHWKRLEKTWINTKTPIYMNQRFNILKTTILPKLIDRVNVIFTKVPAGFFAARRSRELSGVESRRRRQEGRREAGPQAAPGERARAPERPVAVSGETCAWMQDDILSAWNLQSYENKHRVNATSL